MKGPSFDMNPTEPDLPEMPRLTLGMATVFYLALGGIAAAWAAFTEPGLNLLLRAPKDLALPWWLAGLAVGLLLVLATMLAEPRVPALRRLSELLAPMVAPFHPGRIALLALLSGVCEEALFRGPFQHSLGYVAASVVFGLMHGGLSKRYIAWSTFALVAGLTFGLLAEVYGSFWPAALAHVVVNGINLRRLKAVWLRLEGKEAV